jgi:molybdopterin adenylyltransferase
VKVCVLTISDRSSRGEREDASGPSLIALVEEHGWELAEYAVLPDEQEQIEDWLRSRCDSADTDVILTTGGTGFSPRDRTPEATKAVSERLAPGLAEAMRSFSLTKTPHAMLSRAVCGIRGSTLIINLPGSPRAAGENFEVVMPVLEHAVELLQASASAEQGHTFHKPDPSA